MPLKKRRSVTPIGVPVGIECPSDRNSVELAPERSHSIEGGMKLAGANRSWNLNLSAFDMRLNNLEVSADINGNPTRVNAGEERFRGVEAAFEIRPTDPLRLRVTAAAHDPRFVRFETFGGKIPELAARRVWSAAIIYSPVQFAGGSVTVRGLGRRPLDRDNEEFAPAVTTIDASLFVPISSGRFEIVGRNLTNRRFITAGSEAADGLRYVSAPRSVTARMSWTF